MNTALIALVASTFFVLIAEMGDKTQLVALSFATRYKPMKVLTGIFLATLLVHLVSALVGAQVARFIPMQMLKVVVGLSFIGFGIWTLRGDKISDDGKNSRFGPVMTVGIAFFLAELGDKTQLATIALAARYQSFIAVWIGSTIGMVIADGLAIIIGVIAGKQLPEHIIRYVSATIFFIAGIATIIEAVV